MHAARHLPTVLLVVLVMLVILGLAVFGASSALAQFVPGPAAKQGTSPGGATGKLAPGIRGAVVRPRPQRPAPEPVPAHQPAPAPQPAPQAQPASPAQPAQPQAQTYRPYSYGNSPYYRRPWAYGNPPYYQRPPSLYYPYYYVPRGYGYYGYGGYPYPVYYPPLIYTWTPFGFQRLQ